MGDRVALYCPDLPPCPGGVADHTLGFARTLAARGVDVVVLGLRGDPRAFAPIECATGVTARTLPLTARQVGAAWLILQYVPFLHGRWGLAPALVRALRDLRRSGQRLAVFLHEPYVPFTRLPWLITGFPMRWQFRAIMRAADVVWSPVPRFLDLARRAARSQTRLSILPVGSTVPVEATDRTGARVALHLRPNDIAIGVFSPAASGLAVSWIESATETLRGHAEVIWVLFGSGSEHALPGLPADVRVQRLGWLEPPGASRVFGALDLAVAPFVDGLSLRRTSAMAALAHGVPLVSSRGPLFDPVLGDAAVCMPDAGEFTDAVCGLVADPIRREALGRTARTFYETRASLQVAAELAVRDLLGQ